MGKIRFLVKLHVEDKLHLVEPSEAMSDSYLAKSESNIASAKILLDNGKFEESVSLAYYSMYHMLTALLFRTGIKCENHAAAIIVLGAVFGLDNEDISSAKEERIDKQYYADFHIAMDDAEESVRIAEDFNRKLLDFISRLDSQKIKEYRERFSQLV